LSPEELQKEEEERLSLLAPEELVEEQEQLQGEEELQRLEENEEEEEDEEDSETSEDAELKLEDYDCPVDTNQLDIEKINYDNQLAIRSAIKLQKYEVALALCEKIIMEPLILERTGRDIALAVKLYLNEENVKEPIPEIEDLLENIDESIDDLPDEFLRSVYERRNSFDELIWNYVPPKKMKFEYWTTALALDRGQELIKMDINSKLKTMRYEPEYDHLPVREKDEFVKRAPKNWRSRLMAELGIIRPVKDEGEEMEIATVDGD
jgi:hypothetical protein